MLQFEKTIAMFAISILIYNYLFCDSVISDDNMPKYAQHNRLANNKFQSITP